METSLTLKRSEWLEPRQIGDRKLSLMDHLFNRLDGMYPNRWRAAFADKSAIQNWTEAWADAFSNEGITPQQIADGVRQCSHVYDWPPSLTEFLKTCKPQIDAEGAFIEAVKQMRQRDNGTDRWTHQAIYWAAIEFGAWDLRNASWQVAKARWTRILDDKLGQKLPQVPPRMDALPAPGKTVTDPIKVRAIIDECRRRIGCMTKQKTPA